MHCKCRLAHRSSRPNFSPLKHCTETRKTCRTHTVLPCVMHIVVFGDGVFSVAQCEGKNAGVENTPHRPRLPCQLRRLNATHRILCHVKKWQLEHCVFFFFFFFFFIGYNMTSHNLIVFKSVVWKKGDECFRKNAILGLGVGLNPGPLVPKACALPMRHSTSPCISCCIRSLWFDAFKQIKYDIKFKLTI